MSDTSTKTTSCYSGETTIYVEEVVENITLNVITGETVNSGTVEVDPSPDNQLKSTEKGLFVPALQWAKTGW